MRIPIEIFNFEEIPNISIGGRGGHEKLISRIFINVKRVNTALYDYEIEYRNKRYKIEVKKQADVQWFDSGKYHNISDDDKSIIFVFIFHEDGKINRITATTLGEFIEWMKKNNEKDGWCDEVIKSGALFKIKYPTLQFKAIAKMKNVINQAPELFDIIYQ